MPKTKSQKKREETNGKPNDDAAVKTATEAVKDATQTVPVDLRQQRAAQGKSLRDKAPRSAHAGWTTPADRRDPIDLLIESSADRLGNLLPIRYGRMLQTPFTFYRGAAAIMAADLARTPSSGLNVQACGDCHLLNFGLFGTPERRLLFDINDFDETLPAPWEWDVKRLATSFIIASRNNEFKASQARQTALACVREYRQRMAEFAKMKVLELWYQSIDVDELLELLDDKQGREDARNRLKKAVARSSVEHDFPKLASVETGLPLIRDNPPLVFHPLDGEAREAQDLTHEAFQQYRDTLPDERRLLLDRYKPVDVAMKVVGVGSVGTRCFIVLHMAGPDDPLFLQIKEARPSVLEPYAGKSAYDHGGQRVVIGQRLMQSASDIFLGWSTGPEGRHFYVRQLRDMKIKPMVEVYDFEAMTEFAEACGWALARAHAKSGDPAQISGYLGGNDRFDEAIADFAEAYADQNEADHRELVKAVREGRLEANLEH